MDSSSSGSCTTAFTPFVARLVIFARGAGEDELAQLYLPEPCLQVLPLGASVCAGAAGALPAARDMVAFTGSDFTAEDDVVVIGALDAAAGATGLCSGGCEDGGAGCTDAMLGELVELAFDCVPDRDEIPTAG